MERSQEDYVELMGKFRDVVMAFNAGRESDVRSIGHDLWSDHFGQGQASQDELRMLAEMRGIYANVGIGDLATQVAREIDRLDGISGNKSDTLIVFKGGLITRKPQPSDMEFEPIQLCNAKCSMCPYTELSQDSDYLGVRMPREKIVELLEGFAEASGSMKADAPIKINPFRYSDPLVCPDLDIILETAERLNLLVSLTTNGVSFTDAKCELLERYIHVLAPLITISVIGANEEEIKENMALNLTTTLMRLEAMSKRNSPLVPMIRATLKSPVDTEEKVAELYGLKARFDAIGVAARVRHKWLVTNRCRGDELVQSDDDFIMGCGLVDHKVLDRLSVNVFGDVVLCCNEAYSKKTYGNVFRQSIEEIWNGRLLEEHELIYGGRYSPEKNDLLCNTCDRAIWSSQA